MYQLFIPKNKGKAKTSVRGFWYSQENKKTYYDYLRLEFLHSLNKNKLLDYKLCYNQEAIFYIAENKAYIFYDENKTEVLTNKTIKNIVKGNFKELRRSIKAFIDIFGGCTVYICKHDYIIEAWSK
jgi:hypothetical protein